MIVVNVDNFARAETARMIDGLLARIGGINTWSHSRVPTPIDAQTVIRMNRDTLYSTAVVDISEGATVEMPDARGRYMSLMVVNEDHYVNRVIREPGTHRLTVDEYDTPYVVLAVRTFVDPGDPDDLAAVHALQDRLAIDAASATPYTHPDYDDASREATAAPLKELATGIAVAWGTFGAEEDVDPVRHLIGTASGWGGLPMSEAYYLIDTTPRPVGHYAVTVRDVPVDAFWSLTIYNRDGFLEKNPHDSYSLNSVTATADDDGAVTLDLAPHADGSRNHLHVMDGWNFAWRFYRPRPEIVDGTWTPPEPRPVG